MGLHCGGLCPGLVSQRGYYRGWMENLTSGPALAARGCCRMCREQRCVMVFEETSEGGREKFEVWPSSGNEADVPVGVDALDMELCVLRGGRMFRV